MNKVLQSGALSGASLLLAIGTAVVAVRATPASPPQTGSITTVITNGPTAEALLDLYVNEQKARTKRPDLEFVMTNALATNSPMTFVRASGLAPETFHAPRPVELWPPRDFISRGRQRIAVGNSLDGLMAYIFDRDFQYPHSRVLVPPALANARYDYIDSAPGGGRELLQRQLRQKFGIVLRKETRLKDALVLTVKNADAPGLQKNEGRSSSGTSWHGMSRTLTGRSAPFAKIVDRISTTLDDTPIVDNSGLSGSYDYSLNLPGDASSEEIKRAILQQLGFALTPAGEKRPVEYDVAQLIKEPLHSP
jgi:uncharacterized protein (TIGR03435 family)